MRIIALEVFGAIAAFVLLAMLVAIARHRSKDHEQELHRTTALAEYVWATIPWVIIAACALPAVQLILAGHQAMRDVVANTRR